MPAWRITRWYSIVTWSDKARAQELSYLTSASKARLLRFVLASIFFFPSVSCIKCCISFKCNHRYTWFSILLDLTMVLDGILETPSYAAKNQTAEHPRQWQYNHKPNRSTSSRNRDSTRNPAIKTAVNPSRTGRNSRAAWKLERAKRLVAAARIDETGATHLQQVVVVPPERAEPVPAAAGAPLRGRLRSLLLALAPPHQQRLPAAVHLAGEARRGQEPGALARGWGREGEDSGGGGGGWGGDRTRSRRRRGGREETGAAWWWRQHGTGRVVPFPSRLPSNIVHLSDAVRSIASCWGRGGAGQVRERVRWDNNGGGAGGPLDGGVGLESERGEGQGQAAGAGVGAAWTWLRLQRPPPVFPPPYPGRTHEATMMKLRCMFWRRDWLWLFVFLFGVHGFAKFVWPLIFHSHRNLVFLEKIRPLPDDSGGKKSIMQVLACLILKKKLICLRSFALGKCILLTSYQKMSSFVSNYARAYLHKWNSNFLRGQDFRCNRYSYCEFWLGILGGHYLLKFVYGTVFLSSCYYRFTLSEQNIFFLFSHGATKTRLLTWILVFVLFIMYLPTY